MLRFLGVLTALTFTTLCGYAQSVIKGKLIDSSAGSPIEFATLALYNPDSSLISGTITNQEGVFEITPVKIGDYYLVAQFLGYDSKTINNIRVQKNQIIELGQIQLSPNQKMLDEIEIKGDQVTLTNKIDRQVYQADQFQSAQGGTASDLIRNMPAVTIDSQGEISVRGASGFVLLINGKPIQSDPTSFLRQLPANAIANVEIITAPSAKYDPEGKAGLINIITKQGGSDGLSLQFNSKVGLPSVQNYNNEDQPHRYGGDFSLNYRKNKWDLSLGAGYLRNDISGRREGDVHINRGDTLHQLPSDGERSTNEINYSGRFTLAYTPDASNSFSLGFYAGEHTTYRLANIVYYNNNATYTPTSQNLYSLQYYNHNLRIRRGDFALGSIDYTHNFINKSKISTSFLYEYTLLGGPTTNQNLGWPNTNITYQDEYNTNDNPLNGIRYQLDYQFKPMRIGLLQAGYQFRNLDHKGDFVYERKNNETGIFELVPQFSSTVNLTRAIHSGYVQLNGKVGKLSYGGGLRIEMMHRDLLLKDKANTVDTLYTYDFVKPFPSMNIQYNWKEDLRIKAAYSKRIDRTTTFKMNPFPEREHSETLEQGDPTLLPELIDLAELGLVKDFGNNSFFLTTYYRNTKNLINRVNTIYNDSILNRIYSNVGNGQSLGLEIGADLKPISWWKLFLSGNVYQYSIKGLFDNRPVNNSNWIYSINANTTFSLTKTMTVQWSLNYLSARNTAQGMDSRFFNPNLTLQKSWADNRFTATFQWLNMDLGLLDSNEQRITTSRTGEFFTTTNYVYEVDILMLNFSYALNKSGKKAKFIKSEFGEKEF